MRIRIILFYCDFVKILRLPASRLMNRFPEISVVISKCGILIMPVNGSADSQTVAYIYVYCVRVFRVHTFSKNVGVISKCCAPEGRHEVSWWGHTSVRRRRRKFSRSGDLAPGICPSLGMFTITPVTSSIWLSPVFCSCRHQIKS